MESLIRRLSMMYGPKPVYYDGIPLMITNVGDELIEVSLNFNASRRTTPPIVYYNTTGKKSYKKWDLSNITLAKGGTLYLFGENSVVDSTFVVNGNSSIHLDGKLEALLQGQVGTAQFGDYALEGLFKNVTQLESVGDIMPQIIGGVNAPSGYSNGYRYSSLFENTGIVEIPNNFLKETTLDKPHLGLYNKMFFGCTKLTTIPRDLFINQIGTGQNYMYQSMFQNCSNLEVAADVYCQSQAFMTAHSMYRGCKKITDVKVFTKTLSSNHCMQYFVADCDNLQSIDFDINRVTHWGALNNAMLNCKNLTKVSIKVETWEHEQTTITNSAYSNWMKGVSPTGTFVCPKELADATDGYYDEEGNFVAGVGRGADTVPAGWTIDYPIIDARDGDANAMALMAVISQQTHADGTPWVKDSLVMMKSEAEKVEDIGTVFSGQLGIRNFDAFQFFINVKKLSNRSFYHTNINTIIVPNNVVLSNECFYYSSELENIGLPPNINTIPNGCFCLCSKLDMTIPSTVTKIEGRAFGRTSMSSGKFREGITSIGNEAFTQNTRITDIYIPSTVTEYGYAFRSCPNINSIIVDDKNPIFDSRGGCNAVMKGTTLIEGCNNTIVPNETTSIGACAFEGRKFTNTTLDLSNTNITNIGVYCFSGSNVEKIIFPSSFVRANSVSLNTSTLHTVILPASRVVDIAANAINNNTFFYVPDELLDEYKAANVWNTIADRIKPISELPQ